MITLFYLRNGKTYFVGISPEIYNQITLFKKMGNITNKDMAELVYEKFGKVTQDTISQYLEGWADSNKCSRCFGTGKIVELGSTEPPEPGEDNDTVALRFARTKLVPCPQCEGKMK